MTRLTVVGCGTVVPEADRGASSFFLEADGEFVLLDCGPGAVQAMARLELPWDRIDHLIITHFHGDHVGALPGLFFSLRHGLLPEVRTSPLDVWGPVGTRRLFEMLSGALGGYLIDPGFLVRIHELEPDETVNFGASLSLKTHKTPHTEESLAVRVSGTRFELGYTGDTGDDDTLGAFMSGVDLLIAECSLPDDLVGDNHLSPSSVARLAGRASPGLLLLTHIYPQFRTVVDVAGCVADAGFAGRVEVAFEGWRTDLGGGDSPERLLSLV